MRLASSYSLQEGSRGLPMILEYLVIPGENHEGVRLVVNEHLYSGPRLAGLVLRRRWAACRSSFPFRRDPFVRAGRQAGLLPLQFSRTACHHPVNRSLGADLDQAAALLPNAIRIEMAPLIPNRGPARTSDAYHARACHAPAHGRLCELTSAAAHCWPCSGSRRRWRRLRSPWRARCAAETERTSTDVESLKAYYLATGAINRAILRIEWGPASGIRMDRAVRPSPDDRNAVRFSNRHGRGEPDPRNRQAQCESGAASSS